MIVPFNGEVMFMQELDIEDIGSFAIEACNDEGMFWYYVVRTSLGMCSIATSGPSIPDVDLLPKSFAQCRYQIPFKEPKIVIDLSKFLNDRNKKITKAEVVDIDYAIDQFRNLKDYLQNFNEELT